MANFFKHLIWLALSGLATGSLQAQLLSVDINGAAGTQNTAPGFVAWNLSPQTGAGILSADKILTVSPNYAAEIAANPQLGVELDEVLRWAAVLV